MMWIFGTVIVVCIAGMIYDHRYIRRTNEQIIGLLDDLRYDISKGKKKRK